MKWMSDSLLELSDMRKKQLQHNTKQQLQKTHYKTRYKTTKRYSYYVPLLQNKLPFWAVYSYHIIVTSILQKLSSVLCFLVPLFSKKALFLVLYMTRNAFLYRPLRWRVRSYQNLHLIPLITKQACYYIHHKTKNFRTHQKLHLVPLITKQACYYIHHRSMHSSTALFFKKKWWLYKSTERKKEDTSSYKVFPSLPSLHTVIHLNKKFIMTCHNWWLIRSCIRIKTAPGRSRTDDLR